MKELIVVIGLSLLSIIPGLAIVEGVTEGDTLKLSIGIFTIVFNIIFGARV